MRTIIYIVFASLLLTPCAAAQSINAEIKKKLQYEVKGLKKDISRAAEDAARLREDKTSIETDLQRMEEWGTAQEKEKTKYFDLCLDLDQKLEYAEKKLIEEQKAHEQTRRLYHKVKTILGYVLGSLLAFLYLRFGSTLLTTIIPVLGPWGLFLSFAGPGTAFAAGYILVRLFL